MMMVDDNQSTVNDGADGVGDVGRHVPVMLKEVIGALQPEANQQILDGTFGAGGYSRAILEEGANVVAIDRDPDSISAGDEFFRKYGKKFHFCRGEFGDMDILCKSVGIVEFDGVVLDVGVSSMQIDQGQRGFSFLREGPLDMRMGQAGLSAAQVVNGADCKDLTRIIGILGEERHAGRVSRAIVARREEAPIESTLDLARIVEKTLGRKFSDKIHPATRTFQALRIYVNRELEQLASGLFAAEQILKAGGRLVVVTFHSLEDRIVKQFFTDRCGAPGGSRHLPQVDMPEPSFSQMKRSAVKAGKEEAAINPRARSAKMRWAIRTSASAGERDLGLFGREVNLSLSGRIQ